MKKNLSVSRQLKMIFGGILTTLMMGLLLLAPATAQATPDTTLWCWSMQSGAVKGTFNMTPATPGDGTAPAGLYTLTNFSLASSTISGVYPGSISNNVYEFGTQAPYKIMWDGSQPTSWTRDNGLYTNGIGIYSGSSGFATDFVFETNYQSIEDFSTSYVQAAVTPALTPAVSGICPGDVSLSPSPTPSSSSETRSDSLANTGSGGLPIYASAAIVMLVLGMGFRRLTRRSK